MLSRKLPVTLLACKFRELCHRAFLHQRFFSTNLPRYVSAAATDSASVEEFAQGSCTVLREIQECGGVKQNPLLRGVKKWPIVSPDRSDYSADSKVWRNSPALITRSSEIRVNRKDDTYVVYPRQLWPGRISSDVALEVDVVAFLDILGTQGGSKVQRYDRRICNQIRFERIVWRQSYERNSRYDYWMPRIRYTETVVAKIRLIIVGDFLGQWSG